MIQCVIFDLGNVLVDFDILPFTRELAGECDENPMKLIEWTKESGLSERYDSGKVSDMEFYLEFKEKFPINMNFEVFSKKWNDMFVANHEMISLVDSLRKNGFHTALLSNTCPMHYNFLENLMNLKQRMDWIFLSYEMKCVKPHNEIYKKVLETLPFSCEELFFIDDLPENTKAFLDLGVKAHTFTTTTKLKKVLKENRIPLQ